MLVHGELTYVKIINFSIKKIFINVEVKIKED